MPAIIGELLTDMRIAVTFLTRLPIRPLEIVHPEQLLRAQRVLPLVGALIGCAIGLIYAGLTAIGAPALASAAIALGIGALITGALHEDGLADMADGFGGGRDKESKLEIMRDSRLGTYGALITIVSFTVKASALSTLSGFVAVTGLAACHALARGGLSALALSLPFARKDGLAATAGRPSFATAFTSALLALVIALVALPWRVALVASVGAMLSVAAVRSLARRQIGGQTGDVLGAAEQIAEAVILLSLASLLAGVHEF